MRIAFNGFRLREEIEIVYEGNWSLVGFESEDAYREALGIGRSTWYQAISIGQALSQLSLSDMEAIPLANAKLLTQVDASIIGAFPWVREAKMDSPSEFALKIAQRNKQHGIEREPTAQFSVKMTVTAKKFLEETVERFRKEHELATTAEALELLIADVHDRPNAMATMKAARTLIEWTMGRIKKRNENSREFQWLNRAFGMLGRTYLAVRLENPHEEDAKEIYPAESPYERTRRPTGERALPTQPTRSLRTAGEVRPDLGDPTGNLYVMSDGTVLDGSEDDLENGDKG